MAFPKTFVTMLVRQAGWPQERGTFRKKVVVNGLVAAGAVDQLAHACAMLAATQPDVAQRLFASCFQTEKDWTEASNDEMFREFGQVANAASSLDDPASALVNERFRSLLLSQEEIPWDGENGFSTGTVAEEQIVWACLNSLYWGFTRPDDVKRWMAVDDEGATDSMSRARAAGVEFDEGSDGTNSELLDGFREVLSAYEEQVAKLAPAPPALLARLP